MLSIYKPICGNFKIGSYYIHLHLVYLHSVALSLSTHSYLIINGYVIFYLINIPQLICSLVASINYYRLFFFPLVFVFLLEILLYRTSLGQYLLSCENIPVEYVCITESWSVCSLDYKWNCQNAASKCSVNIPSHWQCVRMLISPPSYQHLHFFIFVSGKWKSVCILYALYWSQM